MARRRFEAGKVKRVVEGVRTREKRNLSEKQNDQRQAAQKAWDEWHASVGFAPDDDDYVPMMPPLWEVAFKAGVDWMQERKNLKLTVSADVSEASRYVQQKINEVKRGVAKYDNVSRRVNFRDGVKFDSGKRRVDLVPTEAINALADILTAGAVKYGEHNWRYGMDWSRVYGAAQRHLLAFWGGDDIDDESGMPHLWHALTNIAFLVSYQAMSVGRDDRWKQEDDE